MTPTLEPENESGLLPAPAPPVEEPRYAVAIFAGKTQTLPCRQELTALEVAELLTTHTPSARKSVGQFSLTAYPPGATRADENILWLSGLVLDIDDGTPPEQLEPNWQARGIGYIITSSHGNTPDHPRWRVVFLFSHPVPPWDWPILYPRMREELGERHACTNCSSPQHPYHLPTHPPGATPFAWVVNGTALDPRDFLPQQQRPAAAPWSGENRPTLEQLSQWAIDRAHGTRSAKTDSRNRIGFDLALQIRDNGYDQAEGEDCILTYQSAVQDDKAGADAYTHKEALASLRQAFKRPPREPWSESVPLTLHGARDRKEEADTDATESSTLPNIETYDRQGREIVDETLAAAVAANSPPALFVRAGELTRIQVDERQNPGLVTVTGSMMRERLSRVANWWKTEGKRRTEVMPPADVADLLRARGTWPGIPSLLGIVTAPVFTPDGTLCLTPGYNPESCLYYYCSTEIQIGSTDPTDENLHTAIQLLVYDLLIDFPFAFDAQNGQRSASLSHALSFLLLPFVRAIIDGPTPLHLFDAPKAGTGKSLLMQLLAGIFAPEIPLATAPNDDAEWQKLLITLLKDGPSHILFDNVRSLRNQHLLASLTAKTISGRLLGYSQNLLLPVRSVWGATANNLSGSDEISRRSAWIRLDAGVEKPEERTAFQHPEVLKWAAQRRGDLITACLTLCRRWLLDGRPSWSGGGSLGSYESWTQVMGGILECCGIACFLENREELRLRVDRESGAMTAFVDAWWASHAYTEVTPTILLPLAVEHIPGVVGDRSDRSQQTRLGNHLARQADRVYGNHKIVIATGDRNGNRYQLIASDHKNLQVSMDLSP